MDRQIFLARHGKTAGPFNDDQIKEMTDNGELFRYEWIWDGESPDWKPVPRKAKAPPPRPEVTVTRIDASEFMESEKESAIERAVPVKSQRFNDKSTSEKRFSAILYDHEKAFAGKVWKIDEKSAKFLTLSAHHPFKMGQVIWIDLLHEEKDVAYKLRGAINNIQHSSEGWEISLLADQFPF